MAKVTKVQEIQQKLMRDLEERNKELMCFYSISELVEKPNVTLTEILKGTVNAVSSAGQYPEITCARIILEDQEPRTENFKETRWKLSSDIVVDAEQAGSLEVYYLEEKPESDEGPFLKEEKNLINAVTERLGRIIQRVRASEIVALQAQAIMELSTPVIKVWDKVLTVPLIGTLDSNRTQLVMETLLQRIVDTQSRVVILDISGIPGIDTLVANHLIRTVTATRLLGAECIVTGVSSQVAQTLVHLGVDLSGIITRSSMSDGIVMAFEILNLKVISK